MNVSTLFSDIPDVVLGTILGAGIALLGMLINNAYASARQKCGLTHALRRDVYLPFVEVADAAAAFVAQMPTLPLESFSGENPMTRLSGQMARLNLVAPQSVSGPALRALTQLLKSFRRLSDERLVMHTVASELSALEAAITACTARRKDLSDRLNRHLEEGQSDSNIRVSMTAAHNKEAQTLNLLLDQKIDLTKKKSQMELDLSRSAREEITAIRQCLLDLLIAVRRELHTPTDEESFKETFEQSSKEIDHAMKDFDDKASARFKALFDQEPRHRNDSDMPPSPSPQRKRGKQEEEALKITSSVR